MPMNITYDTFESYHVDALGHACGGKFVELHEKYGTRRQVNMIHCKTPMRIR